MSVFLFDNKIISNGNTYLLKTENDIGKMQVISTLYCEKKVIYNQSESLEKKPSANFKNIVYNAHKVQLRKIEYLIKLAINYTDLSQEIQFLLSRALFKMGIHQEARLILEDMISTNSCKNKKDELYFYLGKINENLDCFEDAISNFSNAISLKPKYADYHNNLGEIYLKLENTKKAVREFREAIYLNKYYAGAHYNLGLAYIQNYINKVDYKLSKNFPDSCFSQFEIAVNFKPKLKNSNFSAGLEYLKSEKWQRAYACFLQAKHKHEQWWYDDFITFFYLKIFDLKDLKINDVIVYKRKLAEALKANPGYPELLNELGIANILLGKIYSNSAQIKFKRAMEINQQYHNAGKNLKLIESDLLDYELLLQVLQKRVLQ